MTTNLFIQQFTRARNVSTPILTVETSDPASLIRGLLAVPDTHGSDQTEDGKACVVEWDFVRGLHGLVGKDTEAMLKKWRDSNDGVDPTKFNPVVLLDAFAVPRLPADAIVFVHNAHLFFEPGRYPESSAFIQAVWNCRDAFKSTGRLLVLLGPAFAAIPGELTNDIVPLSEPLPDQDALRKIVESVNEQAGVKTTNGDVPKAVEAITGLSGFQAEQVTAMSVKRNPADGMKPYLSLPDLWERKRKQIEQTPGLSVYSGPERFADIGGVSTIKGFLAQVLKGREKPSAIVFIDEIEKSMAGSEGDTSGVSQDQLGALLQYMQDENAAGVLFIGHPGAAKSVVSKAAGNEAGIPTIQLDLGAMKGSLVGESQQRLRQALKVVTAVSNSKSLWIATCNNIGVLPPALRRRFTLGTFFFDLPTAAEREAIWKIYTAKLSAKLKSAGDDKFDLTKRPDDEGWTGAEIRQCADVAWRLGCDLEAAARYVVPVARSAAEQIDSLRRMANGKFLSASQDGMYQIGESDAGTGEAASVPPASPSTPALRRMKV